MEVNILIEDNIHRMIIGEQFQLEPVPFFRPILSFFTRGFQLQKRGIHLENIVLESMLVAIVLRSNIVVNFICKMTRKQKNPICVRVIVRVHASFKPQKSQELLAKSKML